MSRRARRRYRVDPFEFAADHRLRPEEVAGLRWDSVDLTACTLTVARVQVIVAGKVLERETATTPADERTLPLHEGTVKALRELRKLQRKETDGSKRGVPAGKSWRLRRR